MRMNLEIEKARKVFLASFVVLGLFLIYGVIASFAVEVSNPAEEVMFPQVRYLKWPAFEGMKQEVLNIVSGTSQSFRFDRPVVRASISDPAVCDITTLNRQEILVNAKRTGRVNLMVWDEQNQIASYGIQSTIDLEQLERILRGVDVHTKLDMYAVGDSVVVQGSTGTVLKAKQMEQALAAFDSKAVSLVQVEKPKQVLLEVRFAEVNRKANKDFGLDNQLLIDKFTAQSLFGRNSPSESGASQGLFQQAGRSDSRFLASGGDVAAPFIPPPRSGGTTDLFFSYGEGNTWVANYLQWLVQKNILKIIARPNLLAKDGESAKFLVGGEFPVPVETENRIQVDYREFGTRLEFKPEVLNDDVLRLKILTEVSELDFSTTVSFLSLTFPTILKRTQETVAELREGETLVISGMISQRINQVRKKFPILGDIPLINRAFRRDEFERTDVELLVIITPHIVSSFDLGDKKVLFDQANIDNIREAGRVFLPAFPDAQGDAINEIFTQGEPLQEFDRPEKQVDRAVVQPKQKLEEKIQVNVQVDVKEATPSGSNPSASNTSNKKQ
ncbi:MAG: pilus assembly protein N-terminal domain-containing protein [Candidatus Omnitrophica bacterium]|nr:pilus assembly protein N-terminal domain-containing protein [Candidatus Omnitrophota bacterium]